MEQDISATMSTTGSGKQNSGKGLKIAVLIASVAAVCGIGFGVYGMIQGAQKDVQASDLKVRIKESDGTITAIETPEIETTTDDGTIITITDSPSLSADELQHYIYVAQWDMKIALPVSLSGFSYRYYTMPGYTSLEVAGVSCATQGQCQYAPEFADLSKTNFSLGAINRFHKDSEPSMSGGEKVFTIGDYDYYYVHPQAVYSIDPNEITWEAESVNLIKDALTNVDNYSAI